MQLASKMGLISFEKSSGWLAGGGNVFTCSGVKAACASTEAPQNKPKVNLGQRGFTEVSLLNYRENDRRKERQDTKIRGQHYLECDSKRLVLRRKSKRFL